MTYYQQKAQAHYSGASTPSGNRSDGYGGYRRGYNVAVSTRHRPTSRCRPSSLNVDDYSIAEGQFMSGRTGQFNIEHFTTSQRMQESYLAASAAG